MHPLNLWKGECISWTVNSWDASTLFIEGRMHFMNCQLVRCILSIYGSEDAFHELSTREMHPLNIWKGECISWTVNSWDASSLFMEGRMHFMNCLLVVCIHSIYWSEDAFHELSTREMHPLFLWKVECISWTVNSWYASSLFMEVRMHFMNCQLVRCILLIYGRENAFHELSTRGMHPLYLWEGECISWTVYSWYASSLIMEGRMHFMNYQLVRCILFIYGREDAFHELSTREMHLSIYGREDAFHELSTREMHPLYLLKVECISWTVNSWDASSLFMEDRMHFMNCQLVRCISLFMEVRMHFMNCQLVRCILLIYGRENAFHELSTRGMHPLYLLKGGCISWTVNSWDASSLFMEGRMHFMNCQLVRCISLFMEVRMHFMNCQLVRCILLIYGRENAFHELSTREMHPLYLWEVECISWTVYSWYASSLFMGGRMHFMNCQLVRCILSFYGR